ncbi:hypothetical protein QMK33_20005 [Hymenobacter sp. H14-R3]|uniref:hypothetical protein n=1 Tax=Hymenobacter sp. H14-R3 TaxID=3046308 RepID=UPI0024BB8F20|nr:hypothetical protein [Hymenobacter sp. H14-R3]MDJ0367439.1 hypothetical protein [Hymenobacter sp. H14-R3]
MKVALELAFPDEQAASVMRLLQAVPGLTMRFLQVDQYREQSTLQTADKKQTAAEEQVLLHEVFGSWKSAESGEEIVRRIYADRQDQPREVEV